MVLLFLTIYIIGWMIATVLQYELIKKEDGHDSLLGAILSGFIALFWPIVIIATPVFLHRLIRKFRDRKHV